MQVEPGNHRYRGWRESRKLVDMIHSVPADLKEIAANCQSIENRYLSTQSYIDTLSDTVVSQIEHLRSQIFYRLKKDTG